MAYKRYLTKAEAKHYVVVSRLLAVKVEAAEEFTDLDAVDMAIECGATPAELFMIGKAIGNSYGVFSDSVAEEVVKQAVSYAKNADKRKAVKKVDG